MRGGFRGGFGGGGGERSFNQDVYADYSGPDQQMAGGFAGGGAPTGPAAFGGGAGFGGGADYQVEPSQQIMVRNVG